MKKYVKISNVSQFKSMRASSGFQHYFFIDDRIQDKEALSSTIDASAKWFVLDSSWDVINNIKLLLGVQIYPTIADFQFAGVNSI